MTAKAKGGMRLGFAALRVLFRSTSSALNVERDRALKAM